MVAEATTTTPTRKRLSKTDRQRLKGKFTPVPLLVRLKARNLYLVQGLGHKEIASQTGLTEEGSQQLASREGWVALRRERKKHLLAAQDARLEAAHSEVLDAIADVSAQHAVQGLDRVGKALESKGKFAARDFQSWTGGVKNLVSIMREIKAPQNDSPGSGATLNMFILRVGDQAKPANAAQEAIEAAPKEINVTASAVQPKA